MTGDPDLSRARIFGLVIEVGPDQPVSGVIRVDDMALVEKGGSLDSRTASLDQIARRLLERSFGALWGSRNRQTGFVPNVSPYADQVNLNTTAALIRLLPNAVLRGQVQPGEADQYVAQVVSSLNFVMSRSDVTYLPPRTIDPLTLAPAADFEESSIDAAFLYLALTGYRSRPSISGSLRAGIDAVLDSFNFAAYATTDGWSQAYKKNMDGSYSFTAATYDGYTNENWLISLAAHLSRTHHVPIEQLYNSSTQRTLITPIHGGEPYTTHDSPQFREPFVQWLFTLFVRNDERGRDTYAIAHPSTDPRLATNPTENAERYQRDMHDRLEAASRQLFVQPDAGAACLGDAYHEYNLFMDFGKPELFMPWSAGFSLLAEPTAAEQALRFALDNDLHGPLGMVNAASWATGEPAPDCVAAGNDFWNIGLMAMVLDVYLDHGNSLLANLPQVQNALDRVFQPATRTTGDFDGGGTTDLAVFRPRNGGWYIRTPTAQVLMSGAQWGLSVDAPITGDFDGDGKSDLAVYRPSKGAWYIRTLAGQVLTAGAAWGLSGDTPLAGDFDGDNRDDLAVYRPSQGSWYIRSLAGQVISYGLKWGLSSDLPVNGDFDGDNKSDLAVYRPSSGTWYIRTLAGQILSYGTRWGLSGDVPVSGDFDGDGKTDLALFRPSNGALVHSDPRRASAHRRRSLGTQW